MKKVIIVPGFWDVSVRFGEGEDALRKHNDVDVRVIDFAEFKNYGNMFNRKTFFRIMDHAVGDNPNDYIYVGYSMGAGYVYDYLAEKKIFPQKLILIDPLLERITNPILSTYYRLYDMYKQGQFVGAVATAHMNLVPTAPVAALQVLYNRSIDFSRVLDCHATFLWGEKDLVCRIEKYDTYKHLFASSELVTLNDHHHNWIVYKEPVEKYFVPAVLS